VAERRQVMPIRWSAVKVSEAADMMEEFVNQAAEPLEQARIVAREAGKIAHLPQYVDQYLSRFIGEVDRAIGGSQFEPIGRLRSAIEAMRKSIPEGAIEAEKGQTKHGVNQSMF
jgi:hypothetical protein